MFCRFKHWKYGPYAVESWPPTVRIHRARQKLRLFPQSPLSPPPLEIVAARDGRKRRDRRPFHLVNGLAVGGSRDFRPVARGSGEPSSSGWGWGEGKSARAKRLPAARVAIALLGKRPCTHRYIILLKHTNTHLCIYEIMTRSGDLTSGVSRVWYRFFSGVPGNARERFETHAKGPRITWIRFRNACCAHTRACRRAKQNFRNVSKRTISARSRPRTASRDRTSRRTWWTWCTHGARNPVENIWNVAPLSFGRSGFRGAYRAASEDDTRGKKEDFEKTIKRLLAWYGVVIVVRWSRRWNGRKHTGRKRSVRRGSAMTRRTGSYRERSELEIMRRSTERLETKRVERRTRRTKSGFVLIFFSFHTKFKTYSYRLGRARAARGTSG